MKESNPRLMHGTYFFKDHTSESPDARWQVPDPDDVDLHESMHTARYSLSNLSQNDAYRILSAAEAYCHFAGHPADTKSIVDQLRKVRNAVKKARNNE